MANSNDNDERRALSSALGDLHPIHPSEMTFLLPCHGLKMSHQIMNKVDPHFKISRCTTASYNWAEWNTLNQISPTFYQFLNGANSGSGRPREEVKKENLTPQMMSKSNQIQLWGCSRTTRNWPICEETLAKALNLECAKSYHLHVKSRHVENF